MEKVIVIWRERMSVFEEKISEKMKPKTFFKECLGLRYDSEFQHVPSMYKALGLIPNIKERKKISHRGKRKCKVENR